MSNERSDVMVGAEQTRALVPKLRFPQFRDAAPWPVKPLSELAKRQSKRNSDHEIIRVLTNSAELGVVDQRDYFEKDIAVQGNLDAYFIVEHGDYVYNPRISNAAPVGPIGKNKVGTGVMSPLYTVFRFSSDNDSFYEQYFRSRYWHSYLRHASNSGARHDRMAITNDDFMQMPLPAPDNAEQQKIADCLSSLEAVIAAEGGRLAALKEHKKGLMQQLFPRPKRIESGVEFPAETTPHLRFPEFEGAGDWEDKLVGDVIVTVTPPKKLQTSEYAPSGAFPIMDQAKTDIAGWTDDLSAVIAEGTPLIVFGDHTCVLKLAQKPFAQGADGIKIFGTGSEISVGFLYQSLQNDPLLMEDYKRHFSQLKERQVSFPDARTGEQERISTCLDSLDELVTAQTDKIEALKRHKSGLMQQLFPSPLEAPA